jgi:hypothetical protein
MMKLVGTSAVIVGLIAGTGCSRWDDQRAREDRDKAQRQLEVTRDKLREDLRHADAQTREDLDKARQQLNQALDQSKQDAEKAKEKLRQEREERDNPDSGDHQ